MSRTLLVVALLLVAGCSFGGPGPTPTTSPTAPPGQSTVDFNVTNADTAPHTITVGIVEGPVTSVELTYADGETRTVPAESPETSIFSFEGEGVTDAVPAGDQEVIRTYDLDPKTSETEAISIPTGATVVFVAQTGGRVTALGLARCPSPTTTTSADFLVGGYGPLVGLGCAG